jgi:uncharacterized protein YgbK (DUF1537 family)
MWSGAMIKLLIIADDFTGALDVGVQFSKKGILTLVTIYNRLFYQTIDDDTEVLVVDIESRHMPATQAFELVDKVVRFAIKKGVKYIFKKTDSTLRGNIGAELSAVLHATRSNQLAFIPAFPKEGRTTVNGIQYVNGIELEKTEFSKDPFEPVKYSSVAEIIRQQTSTSVDVYTKNDYVNAVKTYDVQTISIFDAETNEDLVNLGMELKKANRLNVLAGCAGFAEILPELLEFRSANIKWHGNNENILVVSGSVNQIAIDQMNHAKKQGYYALTLTPEQKLRNFSSKNENLVRSIVKGLELHKKVILESISSRTQIYMTRKYALENDIPTNDLHSQIIQNIGEIIARVINRTSVGNLVVFGGDTLYGILDKIQFKGIIPLKEIAPGIVASAGTPNTSEAAGIAAKSFVVILPPIPVP